MRSAEDRAAPPIAVSVIICVRNGESTLRAQLDALASQQGAPPFEVVIADNGSTDATRRVAFEWIQGGTGAASDAYVVDASEQAGIGFARNVGAASSSAPILAYCDADDVVGTRWVAGMLESFRDGAEVVTGPVARLSDGGSMSSIALDRIPEIDGNAGMREPVPYAWGGNLALTRSAFEAVGGFDMGLPPYGRDDTELGIRLHRAGFTVAMAPDMVLGCRFPSGWRRRLRREYRAGIALAVEWERHPDLYAAPPGTVARVWKAATLLVRTFLLPHQRVRTRILNAGEASALVLGTVAGSRLLRTGHYVTPRWFDVEAQHRERLAVPSSVARSTGSEAAPIVDLITATNRSGEFLQSACSSIIAQTYPNWRHFIVDNGSPAPDALRAAVDAALNGSTGPQTARERITLMTSDRRGVSAARNAGIASGTGEYVAFLDDDDMWDPRFLEEMVAALDAQPNAVAAYCGGVFIDAEGKTFGSWNLAPATRMEMIRGDKSFPRIQAFVARRSIGEAIGWFDERLAHSEDMELICRFLIAGELASVPKPLARYRINAGGVTQRPDAVRRIWMANELFLGERIAAARRERDPRLARQLRTNRRRSRNAFAELASHQVLISLNERAERAEARRLARWALTYAPVAFLGTGAVRIVRRATRILTAHGGTSSGRTIR